MKSMKKSMFVTTILMVVLLIVALSTATFAWYTANTNVGANATQVSSANSNSASLVVDGGVADSVNATGSYVAITMTQNVAPMVWATSDGAAPSVGTTTYGDFIGSFYTFTRDNAGKFASAPAGYNAGGAGQGTKPSTITTVVGDSVNNGTAIYLTNVGGAAINHVRATISIANYTYEAFPATVGETDVSGKYVKETDGTYSLVASGTAQTGKSYFTRHDGNGNLCVAIFSGASNASDDDLVLKGVYSNLATLQRADSDDLDGAVVGTTSISSVITNTYTPSTADGSVSTGDLNASALAQMGAVKVKVLAWFEGSGMNNDIAGTGANFSIAFSVVA